MSKIEDALNKARRLDGRSNTGIRALHDNKLNKSTAKSIISSSKERDEINHMSSTKEISLIDNGEIYDDKKLTELKIITSGMEDKKIANTYRDLRTKLIQKSKGKNFSVMFTSCTSAKTANVSLNVANAFSFDESKTSLLIDCNLSNPKLDLFFDFTDGKGLTDYLENDNVELESIIHKTGIKRLKVIPVGEARETATEYFTSLRMRNLMSNLLSRYSDRYIVLDTAPINESADTRILVDLCDFVVLIVPYATSTRELIKEATDAIGEEKLIGVIFNEVPRVPKFKLSNLFKS